MGVRLFPKMLPAFFILHCRNPLFKTEPKTLPRKQSKKATHHTSPKIRRHPYLIRQTIREIEALVALICLGRAFGEEQALAIIYILHLRVVYHQYPTPMISNSHRPLAEGFRSFFVVFCFTIS